VPDVAAYSQRAKRSLKRDWNALLGTIIDEPSTRRNWRLCLVLQASWAWFLSTSFMTTYYREDMHLSQSQVYILQISWASVFAVGTSLGGWLADRWGIRRVMICGTLLHLAQTVYFSTCREFWQFEIALLFAGAQGALLGGSTDTLCTATLRKGVIDRSIREELYKQYQHASLQVRSFMAPLAILLGNYLWRIDVHLPSRLQIVVYLVPAIVVWKVAEPRIPAPHLTRDIIAKRLRMLMIDRKDIRWASAVFVVSGASSIAGFWIVQPLMVDAHIGKSLFGWIYASQSICIGVFSWVTKPLQKLSTVAMWSCLAATTSIGALGASLGGILGVVLVLVGFSLTRASLGPFLATYLFHALGENDETRATDISIIDSLQTAVFVVVGLVMAGISDAVSAEATFLTIGVICSTLSSVALFRLWRATRSL
jgi:MFS family permease